MLFRNRVPRLVINYLFAIPKESNSIMCSEKPLLSFGIIADVQYADIEDGYNFAKTKRRYYRNALNVLKEAVNDWGQTSHDPQVSFVLNLGDLIDGWNKRHNISQLALDRTLAEFDEFKGPVHHSWGNHDFYNFSRDELLKTKLNSKLTTENSKLFDNNAAKAKITDRNDETKYESNNKVEDTNSRKIYYDFSPYPGFRVVMLDSYEISMLGYDTENPNYKKAEKLLKKHNPNEELNSSIGLEGQEVRWVQFNGGMSETQLDWLNGVLKKADENKEIVIVTSHQPFSCIDYNCLCWDSKQVLEVIHKYSCVIAVMVGHRHTPEISKDEHGIYHYVFDGVVEIKPGISGHAIAHLHSDRLEIEGRGCIENLTIPLPHSVEPRKC